MVVGSHATKSKEAWAGPLPNHRYLEKASSYKVPLVSDRSREREAEGWSEENRSRDLWWRDSLKRKKTDVNNQKTKGHMSKTGVTVRTKTILTIPSGSCGNYLRRGEWLAVTENKVTWALVPVRASKENSWAKQGFWISAPWHSHETNIHVRSDRHP